MYVCICSGLTDTDIREAIEEGAHTLEELSATTGCSSVCGSCGEIARQMLEEARVQSLDLPLIAAAA